MNRKRIFKYIFIFLCTIILTFSLFTDSYLRIFPKILNTIFDVEELAFSDIDGNLFSGFEIKDIAVSQKDFEFKSKEFDIKLTFSDFFNGFLNVRYISAKDGELKLKDISDFFSASKNRKTSINDIVLSNFKVIFNERQLLLNELRMTTDLGKINISGDASLYLNEKYKFDITNISVHEILDKYQLSFNIDKIFYENASFSSINFESKFDSFMEFDGNFNISEAKIFNEEFSSLNGDFDYSNNILTIDMPYNYDNLDESVIGGNVEVQGDLLMSNKVIVKIRNEEPFELLINEPFLISDALYGKNARLNFKSGFVAVEDFFIKDFSDYEFILFFENFDISLFRGLNADGYFAGSLYIANNYWEVAAGASINDFSFDKYNIDEVRTDKVINSNDFDIDDLRFFKNKFGFLDISKLYDRIIHELLDRSLE